MYSHTITNFSQQPICFGTVLQNEDDDHPNQVKVQLAVLYEDGYNEVWANVASTYGGEQYGICFAPEVGEQVIVLFVSGNVPVVLASVRGSKAAPSECQKNLENLIKVIRTKGGNLIQIQDKKDHAEIQIQTPGGCFIQISDENQKITISDKDKKNSVELDAKNGNVAISAEKSISLKIGNSAVLEASKDKLALKSTQISVEATKSMEENIGQLKCSGKTIEMSAAGQIKVDTNGVLQMKGSLVKLNG